MDFYLFKLWKSVPSGHVKTDKLAKVVNLSVKQTTRHLKRWEQEGWLTFISGKGRGNASQLTWKKDIEEEFEKRVLSHIEQEPVEISSKYLLLDWSQERKQRLIEKFQSKFGYIQQDGQVDKLIIPRKYPFMSFHPLKAADVHSANIVATVYNRLVSVDENGVVTPEIAHSWDVTTTKIRLYLKKDVKFHDGSILSAENVVECLERMRKQPQFVDVWGPVVQIHSPAPLIVDIDSPNGCSYILQLLGTMHASIYKETEKVVVGTGSFFIEENNVDKTVLYAFKDHFQERPLLDMIEFVQVPKDYDMVYRTGMKKEIEHTIQVESNSGFGVVIMNPHRESDIKRKEVRDYIHSLIAKHRNEIDQIHPRGTANDTSCLSWRKGPYTVPIVERPVFQAPLKLMEVSYNEKITRWLKEVLDREGVPVEVRRVSFVDTLYSDIKHSEIDLYVHGEIFEMNELFSFFIFLRNGYSPLVNILKSKDDLTSRLDAYVHTPFEQWCSLHEEMEDNLINESIIIPLYSEKREMPFSTDLMNIQIKHFGYVDFSKLWVRPEL